MVNQGQSEVNGHILTIVARENPTEIKPPYARKVHTFIQLTRAVSILRATIVHTVIMLWSNLDWNII